MMMGFGFVVMLMFWGLLIVGAFWLLKSIFPSVNTPKNSAEGDSMNAREILDHRYARGELTRDQYLAMVEDINGGGQE